MKKVWIEVEVKDWEDKTLEPNDFVEYEDRIYRFKGYEYGTYPICEDLLTGEIITLPHY